jgi:hypothetical protein
LPGQAKASRLYHDGISVSFNLLMDLNCFVVLLVETSTTPMKKPKKLNTLLTNWKSFPGQQGAISEPIKKNVKEAGRCMVVGCEALLYDNFVCPLHAHMMVNVNPASLDAIMVPKLSNFNNRTVAGERVKGDQEKMMDIVNFSGTEWSYMLAKPKGCPSINNSLWRICSFMVLNHV